MNREDKNPETKHFHFYNANPFGRYTGDCVVRAISTATTNEYKAVLGDLCAIQMETGYSNCSKECWERYLVKNGWVKHKQPRNGRKKMTGDEFCQQLEKHKYKGNIIAKIGCHHIVAIKCDDNGCRVHDTWTSVYRCIGNYWTKHDKGVEI